MGNEREEGYEGHEEGEYHFSDDQSGYEVEPESDAEAEAEAPVAKAPPKPAGAGSDLMDKLKQYRRVIIGVVVFFVLVFVIYKMVVPSAPSSNEFTNVAANQPKAKPAQPTAAAPQPPNPIQPPTPVQQTQAAETPAPPVVQAPPNVPIEQPNPMTAPPAAAPPQPSVQPVAMPPQPAPMPQTIPQPPPSTPAPMPTSMPTPPPTQPMPSSMPPGMPSGPGAPSAENIDQARVITIIEATYGQKLAEYEAQNAALQARVKEMNKRMGNMESTLNQLARLLMSKQMPPSMSETTFVSTKPMEPKVAYTVQAIIPGRAWLKSDSGETVTVAEGDILKGYGRITKIDPYDGVVEIDTGTKTIALSYGAGGD